MFCRAIPPIVLLVCMAGNTTHAAAESNLDIQMSARATNNLTTTESPIVAGEAAKISFNITGKYDDGAVSGLHPGAWIRPRLAGQPDCKDAVRNYLTVGPNSSRDIDLNSYSFITLNEDNSVGVMDPRLNLASANLLALRKLESPVTDWHLNQTTGEIFLSQPKSRQLGIVSALNGNVLATIALPVAPKKIVAIDNDNLLWIAGQQALMIVDTDTRQLLQTVPLKSNAILLALSSERERLWAYSPDDGELIAVDTVSLVTLWRRKVPRQLSDIAYSAHADRLYFGSHDQQTITTLYPGRDTEITTVALQGVPEKIHITPDGHWLIALDTAQKQLIIIDTAINQVIHYLLFEHEFDQLVFSEQFAYLHHTTSARVSLINLNSLSDSEPPALIEVSFGVTPPGKQSADLPMIVPLPEGGAVIVNNPADKTLFLYMEDGMLAPTNAFKVYTAAPLAVLIHDKSFAETRPGQYETVTMVPRPGDYELVFYLSSPLTVACMPLQVEGSGTAVAEVFKSSVDAIKLAPSSYKAGEPAEVKIRLITNSYVANTDVQMLFFKPGSNWQRRISARANHKMEVSAPITFPEQGQYLLGIQSDSLKFGLKQNTMQTLEVTR